MEIKGKVHCFFEQSGTFKNEFIKLGIPAEDYDIQNNFGQTDHTDDLFKAIEDVYDGKPSLFDSITTDDLIIAFFPCIYFCENNHTTRNDVLILLGDSGILYGEKEDTREHMLKRYLSTLPITILDIQGNHSCPPEDRAAEGYLKTLMKLGDDMVGIAYQNFQYPNIYHAVNGNTYYIAGHPCLVVGGAGSIDKEYRQMMGWYWTEHEVISLQDMNNILHQIHTRHFDFCFIYGTSGENHC